MNWLKIQTEILKALYSMIISHRPVRLFYLLDGENVIVSTDGETLYYIPKNMFLLDLTKCNITETNGLKTYTNKFNDIKPLTDTFSTITRFIHGKKVDVRVFKFEDGTKLYVQSKHLKNFPIEECKFSAENPKSLVYIQHNGQLLGGVFPIRIKDDESI